MINALKNKLVYTAEEVSFKDSNITFYRDRIKELNQNMDNRDYLISHLKVREKDLENKLKLEYSPQGSDRIELSDKKDYDTSSLENPAKHSSTIDKTICSKISAGAPGQKSAEQNITSAIPSIAVLRVG